MKLVEKSTAKLEKEFLRCQKAEEKYRAFIKYSFDGIWAYDLEPPLPLDLPAKDHFDLFYERAYVTEANDALAHMLGYEKGGDMLGMRLDDFQPRTDPGSVANIKKFIGKKFNTTDFETTVHDSAGGKKILLSNILAEIEDGEIVRIWGTSRDITEQRVAECKTKEAKLRYRTMADHTYDWEYWERPDGSMEYVSPSAERITGFQAREFIQKPELLDEIIKQDYREEWLQKQQDLLYDKTSLHMEFEIRKKNGETVWLEQTGQHIKTETGEYLGYRASNRDITERKRLYEELKMKESAIEISQKDLRRFAGRLISVQEEERRRLARELHDDLTQRLAELAISAGRLKKECTCIGDTVTIIENMQQKLIKVSEDVHSISRQLHPSIIEDLGLIDALTAECNNFSRLRGMDVQFEHSNIQESLPHDIAICLFRVSQEGLRNAGKHAQTDKVQVRLASENGEILLMVSDNGAGFDPKKVRHKPGLGLASMRERLRLVNGTFSINSQPGQGCELSARIKYK